MNIPRGGAEGYLHCSKQLCIFELWQVVTGVGFLGAGVMLAKDGIVVGVTSAATIWVLAAIGVAVDIAGEMTAIKLSILVVGILYGVDVLEDYFASLTRGVHSKFNDWKNKK